MRCYDYHIMKTVHAHDEWTSPCGFNFTSLVLSFLILQQGLGGDEKLVSRQFLAQQFCTPHLELCWED